MHMARTGWGSCGSYGWCVSVLMLPQRPHNKHKNTCTNKHRQPCSASHACLNLHASITAYVYVCMLCMLWLVRVRAFVTSPQGLSWPLYTYVQTYTDRLAAAICVQSTHAWAELDCRAWACWHACLLRMLWLMREHTYATTCKSLCSQSNHICRWA